MEALGGIIETLKTLFEGFDPMELINAIIGAIGGLIGGGAA